MLGWAGHSLLWSFRSPTGHPPPPPRAGASFQDVLPPLAFCQHSSCLLSERLRGLFSPREGVTSRAQAEEGERPDSLLGGCEGAVPPGASRGGRVCSSSTWWSRGLGPTGQVGSVPRPHGPSRHPGGVRQRDGDLGQVSWDRASGPDLVCLRLWEFGRSRCSVV